MYKEVALVVLTGVLGWAYKASNPPPPRICGSPGGPPITAPRIKLRDGRYLAYKEHGVPKESAKHKIIFIHAFSATRQDRITKPVTNLPQEFFEELGLYIVSFDRPGYGESDPDPNRTPKSLALDVEELADNLGLGPKFHVMGFSMGGQAVWGCLKYIPHRLAGAALIAPVVNYWWSGFPAKLSKQAYYLQLARDQWALRVAHYAPRLTFWWNTQRFFPASGVMYGPPEVFSKQDFQLISQNPERQKLEPQAVQQGLSESLIQDLTVGFGSWEFDPTEIENPFPDNEGSVHLWQGDDDKMVPVTLQRYVAEKLPWIHYHEVSGSGHMLPYIPDMPQSIIKALLLGGKYYWHPRLL